MPNRLQRAHQVARDTKIEVTISLGPKEVKIANVVGLEEINAKLELLKQGFLYDNIEVLEKYDENKKPGAVPGAGAEIRHTDKPRRRGYNLCKFL